MRQQRPDRAGDGVARLVLAAGDRQLDVGADALHRHAGRQQHAEDRRVRMFRHHRNHVVDRGIDAGGGGMAARLDLLVAGVVGDAVDHRLRPRIHVLIAHVGEAGDVLQALRRQRQRERLAEVGAACRARAHRGCGRHGPETAVLQVSRTVRGDTAGNIAARSDICASPSLRIMLWPISVFISPAG